MESCMASALPVFVLMVIDPMPGDPRPHVPIVFHA
jgi:hypothetical protein